MLLISEVASSSESFYTFPLLGVGALQVESPCKPDVAQSPWIGTDRSARAQGDSCQGRALSPESCLCRRWSVGSPRVGVLAAKRGDEVPMAPSGRAVSVLCPWTAWPFAS